jgi:two-component system, NarL family, competent response regulator ComA
MTRTITAIVAEDHPLMAHASKELLERIEGLTVMDTAYNGSDCIQLVDQHQPDLVFLDYQLPDMPGTKVAKEIKARYPKVRIILFTGVDVSDLADRFLELQINGIISKGTNQSSILHMVHCVMENTTVIPDSIMARLQSETNQPSRQELSEDEIHIMRLLIKGETLEQIADAIHVSKRSVDNYQKRIYEKMGVKTRVQAIEAFIQSKFYTETGD